VDFDQHRAARPQGCFRVGEEAVNVGAALDLLVQPLESTGMAAAGTLMSWSALLRAG
jgi:hypothetical protein